MLGTVVEHLLCLGQSADSRSCDAASSSHQRKYSHLGRRGRRADAHHHAVGRQQVQILIVVVLRRYGVDDEVEVTLELLELRGIARQRELMRSETLGIGFLAWRRAEQRHLRSEGRAELYRHVAESAESDDAELVAL